MDPNFALRLLSQTSPERPDFGGAPTNCNCGCCKHCAFKALEEIVRYAEHWDAFSNQYFDIKVEPKVVATVRKPWWSFWR